MPEVYAQPFPRAVAIVPSDTIEYDLSNFNVVGVANFKPVPAQAIYVGGAGVVAAVFENGSVVNFTAVAGQILPIRTIRVNATNTTATLLVALYQTP